jgi:hypothetical protein
MIAEKGQAGWEQKWRDGYKHVLNELLNTPWDPRDDLKILQDTCDLHVHATSGRIDATPLAIQASAAGQKAIVLKSYHSLTMEPARMAQEVVNAWAEEQKLRPVKVFGGIALGPLFGGINPYAVGLAIKFGAKCVWLPTVTAAGHLMKEGMSKEEAIKKGGYVLKGDSLIPEIIDILNMVSEADIILSLGHLTIEEMFAVAETAKSIGIKKIIEDHPHLGCVDVNLENQKKLVKLGVYLNHGFATFTPLFSGAIHIQRAADEIKEVGAEHCTLCTDTGQVFNPPPPESLRSFIRHLMVCGVSTEEIDVMCRKNPAKLLGIE